MYPTTFHRPQTLDEAASFFANASEPRFIAGGQTLLPTMKQRLAAPSDLVDMTGLGELRGIATNGGILTVGAAETHAEVAGSEIIRSGFPALAALAASIGDPAVRHRGTLGGSLANNDPAADYPAAVLALDAVVVTDRREMPAEAFFDGLFATTLEDGEIITGVRFPVPARAAYAKFRNPASRYAMAGVFVAMLDDGTVRVGVTGASGEGVYRATEIEVALTADFSPTAVNRAAIDDSIMLSDIHGSAAYRANLVRVMAKRAVAAIA